jgi:hypothetical protein
MLGRLLRSSGVQSGRRTSLPCKMWPDRYRQGGVREWQLAQADGRCNRVALHCHQIENDNHMVNSAGALNRVAGNDEEDEVASNMP